MSQPRIAIIGAGIGGLALAIGLLKQSVPVTIYESAPKFDAVGAGIGLGPNALRAMELLDPKLVSLFNTVKYGNTSPTHTNEQFELLSAAPGLGLDQGWTGAGVGHPQFERSSVHRQVLLEVMASLVPRETVRFGKRVVSVCRTENDQVELVFGDGKTEMADVVIGCDGIKGMTRGVVLGERWPGEVRAKYAGTYVYRHIASMEEVRSYLGSYAEDARWFMGVGKGMMMYPMSGGNQVNLLVLIQDANWEGEQATLDVSREAMDADLLGMDDRIQRLLQNAKPARWPLFHHPDTPTYIHGRIALLGDAAHATIPAQAAGAGQAIEDALILSRLLKLVKRSDQIEQALQVYNDLRQPRAQAVVRQSHAAQQTYYLTHPGFGADLQKITDDANQRLPLLWWYDLERDVRLAEERFASMI